MWANWGIGVVPPHLMPKPVVIMQKRCGTCRWYDGPKYKDAYGSCTRSLIGTPLEKYEGMVIAMTGPQNKCGLGDKWEAK